MPDIEQLTNSIVKNAAKKLSPITFLSGQVRRMERDQVEQLAIAYLLAQVRNRKRGEVLAVERANQEPRYGTEKWATWAAKPENAKAARSKVAFEEHMADWEATRSKELWQSFSRMMDDVKAKWQMEWSTELLNQKFALGDGTDVTWGNATREQHEYRYKMHANHAVAGIEGASRHKAAIEVLDSTGASSLNAALVSAP